MLGKASNALLEQAEQGVQSKIAPSQQAAFGRIVHAGLTIMYAPQLAQQRQQRMASVTDPVSDAAQGAARMMSNLYQQSGKKMPTDLIVPAALVLGYEWLDLLAHAGKAQITQQLIEQATQAIAQSVLNLMGLTPDKIAQLKAQAQGAQPAQAGIIAQAQGGA
jgi:hypothetical protein